MKLSQAHIMSYTIYSTFFFIIFVYGSYGQKSYLEEYCWREYEGVIPQDALAGGQDRNGWPIYIGQALYESKLIPGKIYVNDSNVYFAWYNEKTRNQNVKILCTPYPEKFKWIKTKNKEVKHLTNTILIKGGFEPYYSTYIGRILYDGETSVGKIICGADYCLGLHISTKGAQQTHREYEILIYSPESTQNATDKSIIDLIDVRSVTT